MISETFYANGKLMITGEYLVMEGALALALPLKMGQSMQITQLSEGKNAVTWNTLVKGRKWFEATFDADLQVQATNSKDRAFFIQQILQKARGMNSQTLNHGTSTEVICDLSFLPEWGFGSSSSLLSNMADWFKVNPYELFWKTAVGSGYDIACARAHSPVLYQLQNNVPQVQEIHFRPPFAQNLRFVYLGKKQLTASSLTKYRMRIAEHHADAQKITQLTQAILTCQTQDEFDLHLQTHEQIIAHILNEMPVKEKLFADFKGTIKSLGAWGGDFILVSSHASKKEIQSYFNKKGLWPVFDFDEIVL